MINFNYIPIKEITIYQIEKHSLDDFLRLTISANTERLGWADGNFYFLHFFPIDNEKILEDVMKGIQHFASVDYAEGPFKSVVKHPDHQHNQVVVIDQTNNPTIKEMMAYLKEHEKND